MLAFQKAFIRYQLFKNTEEHRVPELYRKVLQIGLVNQLSLKEQQVLYHIADGKSVIHLAHELVISYENATRMIRRVFRKMNVTNHFDAALQVLAVIPLEDAA